MQLIGCAYLPPVPYVIDVKQGNVVTQDMVEKLKYGMSRSQVRFVLGSPLVVDAFRNNRWDYVYSNRKGGRLVKQERLTVLFEDDVLVGLDNHTSFDMPVIQPKPVTEMSELQTEQGKLPLKVDMPNPTANIATPNMSTVPDRIDQVDPINNETNILQTNQ